MAYENFPAGETTPQATPPPQKNNMRNLLTGGLLLALLGTWGYIIYDKNQTKEKDIVQDTQIAKSNTEKDELRKELDDATMRYDMIKTSSANMSHSKDSIVTQRDKEIAQKRVEINRILSNAKATK